MRLLILAVISLLAGCNLGPRSDALLSNAESAAVLVVSRVLKATSDAHIEVLDVVVEGADATTVLTHSRPEAKQFRLTSGDEFEMRAGRWVHQRTGRVGATIKFVVSEVTSSAATIRIFWIGAYGEHSVQRYSLRKEGGSWVIKERILEAISYHPKQDSFRFEPRQ